MKPEAQLIAIAGAVPGWWWDEESDSVYKPGRVMIDPPNDLNAMHEAEKVLEPLQKREYAQVLARVMFKYSKGGNILMAVFATAAQRAEAFLRTKGLWK